MITDPTNAGSTQEPFFLSSEPKKRLSIEDRIHELLIEFSDKNGNCVTGYKMNGVAFLCGWFQTLAKDGTAWGCVEFVEAMEGLVSELHKRF